MPNVPNPVKNPALKVIVSPLEYPLPSATVITSVTFTPTAPNWKVAPTPPPAADIVEKVEVDPLAPAFPGPEEPPDPPPPTVIG